VNPCEFPGCPNERRHAQGARYCADHAISINGVMTGGTTVTAQACDFCGNSYPQPRNQARARTSLFLCPGCRRAFGKKITMLRRHQIPWATIKIWLTDGSECWICQDHIDFGNGDTYSKSVNSPVVDHDHRCHPGDYGCEHCVRGLAHMKCNLLLGHLEAVVRRFGEERVTELVAGLRPRKRRLVLKLKPTPHR
jgi:hypothetical protein